MKGKRKRDFVGRKRLKRLPGGRERGAKAEGCRRDGELDEKGTLRSWEEMALGFLNTSSISLGIRPRPVPVLWYRQGAPKRQS